jgi:hypothetical protein
MGQRDRADGVDRRERRSALDGARAAVAEWLGVGPDAFDVEAPV